jgi:hypothetical protein
MVTLIQAISRSHFEHTVRKNADGSRLRARRNGMTKTCKTKPDEFKIPIKMGLYGYGYITNHNAHEWDGVR